MLVRLLVAAILCCTSLAHAQEPDPDELPRPEFGGLNQKQITKRIFSKERDMISKLGSLRFVTEAYMQSLGHRQVKGLDVALDEATEGVIDDAYFLARVEFGQVYGDSPVERVLIGERPSRSDLILTNAGRSEYLFAEGFLAIFFPDLYGFNADMYSLFYKERESLVDTDCLVFSVAPVSERASGRFRGEIWVDSSSYAIVRLKGVFTGPYDGHWYTGPRHYYHFDSWREKVGNGSWLPSAAYFDERRTFRADGNLEFHFRGYALLWQQQKQRATAPQMSKSSSDTGNTSVLEGQSVPVSQNNVVARLDADGLLANPGEEEQRLDRIVHQIAPIGEMGTHKIACRLLLTTPAEMFAVGDLIIVSRGLLNIVPDDSVLAFMLARQVAHIVSGQTGSAAHPFFESLFDLGEKKEFTGFGIRWRPDEETAADSKAIVLIRGTQYDGAVADTAVFLSELKSQSHRFPSLVRARFGAGVIRENGGLAFKEQMGTVVQGESLRFENRYGVSWNRVVIDSEEESEHAEGRSLKRPAALQTSVAK